MFRVGRVVLCFGLLAGCAAIDGAPPSNVGAVAAPTRDGFPDLPSGVRLIGLGGGELEGLLGHPTLIRSEQRAQYWRYSLGECQLDLFLYAEPASALSRVVYLDVRPSGYAPSGEAAICGKLAALLRGEPAPSSGARPEGDELPVAEES